MVLENVQFVTWQRSSLFIEGISRNKDVRDYHCSVSLGILWRENQNTMIVESQIDSPSTTQRPKVINHQK